MITIAADKSNGRVEFPADQEVPDNIFEVFTDEDYFYFFETKEERDLFYDERGIPHD